MTDSNLAFYGTYADKEYLRNLKSCTDGRTCFIKLEKVTTIGEVVMFCEKRDITGIISTSIPLLQKLLSWTERKAPSLNDYAGSLFKIPGRKGGEIEVVFIHPVKQIVTVPYGRFLAQRYISKLTRPQDWMEKIPFDWCRIEPETFDLIFDNLSSAFLIAIDIETFKQDAQIRCVAFCGVWYDEEGGITSYAYVLPLDSTYNLALLRKLCWELQAPKVFQNGKYDISYLTRYGAPVYNYLYDTANMMHSWYAELPKSLGALNSFFVRESQYWKDLAHTDDLYEYYHYNALDTYATGVCAIIWLLTAPDWAKDNYRLEFPNVFPCHLAEMTGIARDMEALSKARAEEDEKEAAKLKSLRLLINEPDFNPGSPKQVLQLIHILGHKDIKTSEEKDLQKARFRHPFSGRILGLVVDIRKSRKLTTNYLTVGERAKEFHRYDGTGNRILYALNPHGTDTSRLASREHHFWCGLQIHNISRGKSVKQTLVADPGFYLAEVDLEQAESRDTAYISGEEKLIEAVEGVRDFHSVNVEAFFGVSYDSIYDDVNKVVLNKKLRDIGKRVNHGANYNMGAFILLETMGEEKMLAARNLLGLPKVWSLKEVAQYLLDSFHKTYPKIRSSMYAGVIEEVGKTKMLSSTAMHHTDIMRMMNQETIALEYDKGFIAWTRYCFGDPSRSKMILNSYIAHPPQSLNAQTLNKAWIRVFHEIAINPKHAANFKLIAQVHDSILFQYRIGHDYLCDMVAERMEIPITIEGYDKKIRTFTVPAGIKKGIVDKSSGKLIPATHWSMTE